LARSRKTKLSPRLHNPIVMSLVQRGGDIRSTRLDYRSAMGVIRGNVHKDSRW